jgi:hypothetical protein
MAGPGGRNVLLGKLLSLVNGMVVLVASGDLHASLAAMRSFTQLHRLLLELVDTTSAANVASADHATLVAGLRQRVDRFVAEPAKRLKTFEPNLGELLVVKLLFPDSAASTADFLAALATESKVRGVRWYLKAEPRLRLESLRPAERIELTFKHTATPRKLVCFQVYFDDKTRKIFER